MAAYVSETHSSSSAIGSSLLQDGHIWARSIVYSYQPKQRRFVLPDGFYNEEENGQSPCIIKYSQLYDHFVVKNTNLDSREKCFKQLLRPSHVLTGDVLQAGGYRGVDHIMRSYKIKKACLQEY